jgi:IgGFc binding protein
MPRNLLGLSLFVLAAPVAVVAACSATADTQGFGGSSAEGPGGPGGPGSGTGGLGFDAGGDGTAGSGGGGDPQTCEQAATSKTYIGCDFWPTVVANNVWSVFDYAVVVANAGMDPAEVTVTRGGTTVGSATIPPNQLSTIYLPWVPELKGPDADACGSATPLPGTVRVSDGAYHLVSTRPVTVYQFNALEYAPQGGPPGKDWGACPAQQCLIECFSYSNDASLLLPSTAMTGNYRITGQKGWQLANIAGYFAVTGTQDNTSVTVFLSSTAAIQGGGGVPAANANGQVTFNVNAGEVVEVLGTPQTDLSGTLVQATNPVQVIFGMPCAQSPEGVQACDHIEESVFPAETLGQHYFVTVPTGPNGDAPGHVVRIYGNVDGTALSYGGGAPPGAPTVINAGQVVDLNVVSQSFEIQGDHEFAVGSFQLGAELVDPNAPITQQRGDPAQSLMTAVEQYRLKYIFLAPSDYSVSYVDVVQPMDATVTIDGADSGVAPTQIASGYGIARIQLGLGNNGAHVLTASAPVGIQVVGYGNYTSYQYPGGLNLDAIAPPPPPPQ